MNFLVDPVVLALPQSNATEKQCLQFIMHLSNWCQIIRAQQSIQQHEFFMSESCLLALYESEAYPEMHKLLMLWNAAHVEIIDCRTAYNACKRIVENLPHFEDRVSVRDLHIDHNQVHINPDLIGRLSELVAKAFQETLGSFAYAKEITNHPIASSLMLVTHPIKDGLGAHIAAIISSEATESQIETDISLIETPDDLREVTDLETIWQDASQGIAWAISKLKKKGYFENEIKVSQYTVSSEFHESIQKNHYEGRTDLLAQIFTKIALLLTGNFPHKETRKNHRLKLSNEKDWEAWRLWIPSGALGMRLHYWWKNGHYILSKVGPHEDYSIGPVPEVIPLQLASKRN